MVYRVSSEKQVEWGSEAVPGEVKAQRQSGSKGAARADATRQRHQPQRETPRGRCDAPRARNLEIWRMVLVAAEGLS